ncbi:hypothetical protein M408DRAFT_333535 [Serendipita vermifera MAFF 305830]|uniref:NmrA-like domain-containing protein n=1 Tax=Serendipita vermifera MAFF 305830 TaxID=933852 RepID=A0A0C2W4D6_SERVB|nr:hypothetical protein M408DRAFT_333535 [Serendipita vermifera MAFF 305830]
MSYQKIVQVGAGGNVGVPVLQNLIAAGKFEITVLARQNSSYTAPNASVKVVKVDYTKHQDLVDALKGHDALVLTQGDFANLFSVSKIIIDAAIEAGVKRIIPSEFGNDLQGPAGRAEVVFTPKHQVNDYLVEKSTTGQIEFTVVATGPFFDWGITHQFLGFDIPNKKATIYSGGNARINTTNLDTIGAAVAAILANPSQYKNKFIRISDFHVSQNEILSILEAETGSKFSIEEVDVDKLKEDSGRGLAAGEWNDANIYGVVKGSIFGSNSSANWGPSDDTEGLGIPKKDLRTELKKLI